MHVFAHYTRTRSCGNKELKNFMNADLLDSRRSGLSPEAGRTDGPFAEPISNRRHRVLRGRPIWLVDRWPVAEARTPGKVRYTDADEPNTDPTSGIRSPTAPDAARWMSRSTSVGDSSVTLRVGVEKSENLTLRCTVRPASPARRRRAATLVAWRSTSTRT